MTGGLSLSLIYIYLIVPMGNTDHNEILTKKPSFNFAFYFVHVLKAEK